MKIPQEWLETREQNLNDAIAQAQGEIADLAARKADKERDLAELTGRLSEIRDMRLAALAAVPVGRLAAQVGADDADYPTNDTTAAELQLVEAIRRVMESAGGAMQLGNITRCVNRILGTSYSRDALRPLVKQLCNVSGKRVTTTYTIRTATGTANAVMVAYALRPPPPEDDGDK